MGSSYFILSPRYPCAQHFSHSQSQSKRLCRPSPFSCPSSPRSNPCKYRVYLFTTHQPATAHEPASWALHVRARALTTDEPPQEIPVFPAFSSFLRSLDIEIAPPAPEADPSAMQVDGAGPSTAPPPSPGGAPARYSWLRERALGAPTDSFEVRRLGSSAGVRVRVRVEMQRDCEDSALSAPLADLLGTS